MDHLPQTLLCLLDGVKEQYQEFSWTSQEQNGKMRITLIWTNEQYKQYKSNATKKRDAKRQEQYIANKQECKGKQNTDVEKDKISIEDKLESDNEMEVNDNLNTLCDASTQVNIRPVINRPIRKTPGEIKRPCEKVITDAKNIVSDNPITQKTNTQDNANDRLNERRQSPKYKRRFLSKVVIKNSCGSMTKLIGTLPGKDFLLVHDIPDKKTDVMPPDHYDFRTYKKNVTEDFKDVYETDFMDDIVDNAIRLMEIFVAETLGRRN